VFVIFKKFVIVHDECNKCMNEITRFDSLESYRNYFANKGKK